MSKQPPKRFLWEVVPATGPSDLIQGVPIHHHAEWIRMLVGRSLALAQQGVALTDRFDFLVLGVPLESIASSPARSREILDAVVADLGVLKDSHSFHRAELKKESKGIPIENPLVFLRSYEAIAKLRLPEPGDAWRITDEGLTIVQWGVRDSVRSRRFLDFRPQDFDEIERVLTERIEKRLGKPERSSPQIERNRAAAGIVQSIRNAHETPPPSRG